MIKFLAYSIALVSSALSLEIAIKQYPIQSIQNNKTITIKATNLKIGQSGAVLRTYDNETQSIIGIASVIASNENNTTLLIHNKEIAPHDAVPKLITQPRENDTVLINYLYANMLVVAKNFDVYQAALANLPKANIITSDTLAAQMYAEDTVTPTKSMLQKFAQKNNIGIFVFGFNDMLYLVDTRTFATLEKIALHVNTNNSSFPFFSNIEEAPTSLQIFNKDNYLFDSYYQKLLQKESQ